MGIESRLSQFLMEEASDEFAPSYLLHRMNRVKKLPHAVHPFQSVNAEKMAPPMLPNQTLDDAEENQELRSVASLRPSLHWGAAVRAAPLLPPHLGRVLGKPRPVLFSKKALASDSSIQEGAPTRPPTARAASLYATLPAVGVLNDQEGFDRCAASTRANVLDNASASQFSLKTARQSDFQAQADNAPEELQITDDFDANGAMAAWISLRKAFDTGSISWDLRLPLYSQELIDSFVTDNVKQKRPGVVADLRARATQRQAKGAKKEAALSDEEIMAQKEKLEVMRRNKKAMDLRLGRLIATEEADKAGSTTMLSVAQGKTGTKTNAELEFEAIQLRAIQAARETRLEDALASSSRLRAVGHVYEQSEEGSMAQVELRLEALRSYKLSILYCDAHCEQIQAALKNTFYFSASSSQEQDFFVYALRNCSVKEPYILDMSGCSLSEMAGSGIGLMMSTPMNQLTALHARDVLISFSSWRFMCDGIRISRTLAVLDISFARGAPQSSEGMTYFSSALKKNVSLIELIAQGLPLSVPEHAISLTEAIATHVRIRKLDLSDCAISDFSMNVWCLECLSLLFLQLPYMDVSHSRFRRCAIHWGRIQCSFKRFDSVATASLLLVSRFFCERSAHRHRWSTL